MADEEKGDGGAAGGHGGGDGGGPPKTRNSQLLLVLANTVLMLAALGTLVYTKLLFERPSIVEGTELVKAQEAAKAPVELTEKIIVPFDQLIVNIAMTSGKSHFATVAFSVECRDELVATAVKAKKALFVDKLVSALGRRQITELNTIQGKLLLKTELMRRFGELTQPGGVTDIYFSNFILQ